jgi:hypothetical protein
MSAIKLSTPSSGSISLSPADTASNLTITVPAITATMATLTTPAFVSTIGVGGATPAASGAGITFPATQSASSDANTLDDYEEGTWTPTITAVTGSYTTVTTQTGAYTKIGRQVTLRWYFIVSSKGTGSGGVNISNLPFASNVTSNNFYSGNGYDTSTSIAQTAIMTTTTSIQAYKYDGTDPIVAGRGQVGQITYFV